MDRLHLNGHTNELREVVDVPLRETPPPPPPSRKCRNAGKKRSQNSVQTPVQEIVSVGPGCYNKSKDRTKEVAMTGVALCGILSAALNGYQHSLHSPEVYAGWALGIAVPVLVLILGRVSGGCWRRGHNAVAWSAALSGVALLALSVYHCSEAIAILTGSPLALAVPLAVAIDCGLVSCEIAVIVTE